MTLNFSSGDKLSILILSGPIEYIKKGLPDGSPPYVRLPGGASVTPVEELYESTAPSSCKVSAADFIQDNNGEDWAMIIGGRPANIIRR